MAHDREEVVEVEIDLWMSEHAERYLRNRRSDLATIRDDVAREDFAPLRVLGHNLKGSGSAYGFNGVSELGRILERAAALRDAATVLQVASDLESYLDRVRVVCR